MEVVSRKGHATSVKRYVDRKLCCPLLLLLCSLADDACQLLLVGHALRPLSLDGRAHLVQSTPGVLELVLAEQRVFLGHLEHPADLGFGAHVLLRDALEDARVLIGTSPDLVEALVVVLEATLQVGQFRAERRIRTSQLLVPAIVISLLERGAVRWVHRCASSE